MTVSDTVRAKMEIRDRFMKKLNGTGAHVVSINFVNGKTIIVARDARGMSYYTTNDGENFTECNSFAEAKA